jgi:mRNA interferase HigB
MRLIAQKTINQWCTQFPEAKGALEAWALKIKDCQWSNSQELKKTYSKTSIINQQRVVFKSIKGNDYRLVVDINYKRKEIYTIWFGTHKQYDQIDVETITYEKP